ncbi:Glycerophosphoryl diester phosphodiesterase [Roseimaritima multifibrata]|uniref:Glycerophosphoryl diester phosphodiesterase n=2 Tax=Roseimaritima multifibrata TaxID=1930274 RepID=A0A517M9Y6_9BACT|nr:Glycerophosphoryl diester phosphodiesterase [Roseimaritima multifibrata]
MLKTTQSHRIPSSTVMRPARRDSYPRRIVGCVLLFAGIVGTAGGRIDACLSAADLPSDVGNSVELAAAAQGVQRIAAHRGAMLDRPENTIAAIERAIEAGATAVEIDIRTSRDGKLLLMHDSKVNRTTNGTGRVNDLSWAELEKLDAGSWFGAEYAAEQVPSLDQILQVCRGRIEVQLDLKEEGAAYADRIAASVKAHGEPTRMVVAVRSVEQAKQIKQRLPEVSTLIFLRKKGQLDSFLAAKVDFLRPQIAWLENDPALLKKIRDGGAKIHFDATTATSEKVLPLLKYRPESLLCDDPAQLVKTLAQLKKKAKGI